ncbi:MAG: ABC transporter permease [Vicinamibacterales bacterium]
MRQLLLEVRSAARTWLAHPVASATAVLTLALGLAAGTVIFGVANAVLLRPLPYVDGAGVVVVESYAPRVGPSATAGLSPGDYWDLADGVPGFAAVAGVVGSGFSFVDADRPEAVPAALVTPSLFEVLDARARLGRVLDGRDTCAGCPPVAVLSHGLWMRRFGGDPSIVGQRLEDGTEIVGVMPEGFAVPYAAEVWTPLPDGFSVRDRGSRYVQVFARLAPDIRRSQASATLDALTRRIATAFPAEHRDFALTVTPLRDRMVRDVRPALLVLLAGVGVLLAIGTANVAGLLLARVMSRRRELALRTALGATPGRLFRQMTIEGLLLAGASAAVGTLLAVWAGAALLALLPEAYDALGLPDELPIDGRLAAFVALLTLALGLGFGWFGARQAAHVHPHAALEDGMRTTGGRRPRRLGAGLVGAEVALAFVLLSVAGLLVNSYLQLRQVAPGFDTAGVFGVALSVPPGPPPEARVAKMRQLLEAVAAVPDVESAALSTGPVFPYLSFQVRRADQVDSEPAAALYDAISPGYFATLRAPLVAGRAFDDRDTAAGDAVAVVNEALARRMFPGGSPLDQRLTLDYLGRPQTRRIVGVIGDLSQGDPTRVEPQVWVPYTQQPWLGAGVVMRARSTPARAHRAVQAALWSVDPSQPVSQLQTAEERLGAALAAPRLNAALLGLFASVAALLAAMGVFGLVHYAVAQRTREFGIRKALGASTGSLVRMVLATGLAPMAVGLFSGLAAAGLLTRGLEGLLFGVTPTDPLTLVVAAAALSAAALLACWVPARRIAAVDPVTILRTPVD